ncbi:MAG: hypothetical protein PHW04_18395 [Candidatus Wallbacteria bacterium]|nr:hypothetical protein [Candidatus Wallbacteria bacterium]
MDKIYTSLALKVMFNEGGVAYVDVCKNSGIMEMPSLSAEIAEAGETQPAGDEGRGFCKRDWKSSVK